MFSIYRIFFPVFYDNDAKQTDWILHEKRKKNNVKRHEYEQFIVQLTSNGEQKTKKKHENSIINSNVHGICSCKS